MGRLFWKFFLCILLAQLAATAGIGGAIWLRNQQSDQAKRPDIDTGPPAEMAIEAAAATLAYGGKHGLQQLLENTARHRVFAVGDDGKELLGRIINPAMLAEAQRLIDKGDQRVVRHVTAADGQRYLLFLPSREHEMGPQGVDGRRLLADAGMPGMAPPRMDGERPPPPRHSAPTAPDAVSGELAGAAPGAGPRPAYGPGPGPGPGGPPPRFRPLAPYIPLAAAVLASLLFAALLAWYFSRPISALREAFNAASQGDLAPRFAASRGGDELNDLGRDFDRMSGRLRNLLDSQTRLLHDVSHELRSPLARLQAAIGLAHQQPEKMAATLERIERESARMDKLVGELLTLSRLEAGALAAPREDIAMADLLDGIVADAEFEAASHGRTVQLAGGTDCTVSGQPDLLARAIENVVRNAVKHSPAGAMVQVESALDAAKGMLLVRVLDRGPGVAPQDLQAIFEPFYRSSGQKDVDGHGLGLAIARQVVQQHGGTITAANRSDGGLCVEITLPLA